MVTYEQVKHNEEINAYIKCADEVLESIGYTEHSYAHVTRAAEGASRILKGLEMCIRDSLYGNRYSWYVPQ